MKRIISLCLVSAFVCSAASPVFAQRRTRDAKVGRTKSNEQGNRFASVRAGADRQLASARFVSLARPLQRRAWLAGRAVEQYNAALDTGARG